MSSMYFDSTHWQRWQFEAAKHIRGYYVYNLLEEIDQPGEWYLDRQTGKLYLYPAQPLETATIEVSTLEQPMLLLTNTAHVQLAGITFTCARGMAVYQQGTHHITIDSCRFANLGTVAVAMGPLKEYNSSAGAGGMEQNLTAKLSPENFHHNVISNCLIYNTGTGGVTVDGGNRQTLEPASNQVVNCEFHHVDRINHTYSAAINIRGVGAVVRHCFIHDLRHWGICFMGNDHLIEYNHLERVCTDADDMGAIYTGRNPSARGTIIQFNYLANIEPQDSLTGMCGVYVDDGSGGIIVRNNLFYKTGNPGKGGVYGAVYIHGGFDNIIQHNVFLACRAAVGNQPWSDDRWATFLKSPLMETRLQKDVDILSTTYQKRYPDLKDFFTYPNRRLNRVIENAALNTPLTFQGDYWLRKNVVLAIRDVSPTTIDYAYLQRLLPSVRRFPLELVGLQNSRVNAETTSSVRLK